MWLSGSQLFGCLESSIFGTILANWPLPLPEYSVRRVESRPELYHDSDGVRHRALKHEMPVRVTLTLETLDVYSGREVEFVLVTSSSSRSAQLSASS